jgi:hypothetical protein
MGGIGLLTDRQREWMECQKVLFDAKPIKLVARPRDPWRRRLWAIGHSNAFFTSINVFVTINMAILAADHWQPPEIYAVAVFYSNIVFVLLLLLEACIKLAGFGVRAYFREKWHRFDFFIVVVGFLDLVVSSAAPTSTAASVFRVVRTVRGLRLVRVFRGLQMLFDTLTSATASFASVGSVLLLVSFCYAIAGVSLYGHLDLDCTSALDSHNNFQSVPNVLLMLMRTSTGEAWDTLLFDTVDTDCGGGPSGYMYWISFVVLINFVMLQMFMMVVVDSYRTGDRQRRGASEQIIRSFRSAWRMFDPRGTGFMPSTDLESFLRKLPPPMGMHAGGDFAEYLHYAAKLRLASWAGMVAFRDVLLSVHRVTYGLAIGDDILETCGLHPAQIQARVSSKIRMKLKKREMEDGIKHAFSCVVPTSSSMTTPKSRKPLTSIPPRSPVLLAHSVNSLASSAKSIGTTAGDKKRASYRASKQLRDRRTPEIELPTNPLQSWVAASQSIQERRALRHADKQRLLSEAAAIEAEQRKQEVLKEKVRRKDAHRRHTLYRSHVPNTDIADAFQLVVVSERIQRTFRDWRERARVRALRQQRTKPATG